MVSRSGYTGEDGFEVYTEAARIGEIWDLLLHVGDPHGLKPAGLGLGTPFASRRDDALRTRDVPDRHPYEVVYGWITDLDKDFIGRDALAKQKKEGVRKN